MNYEKQLNIIAKYKEKCEEYPFTGASRTSKKRAGELYKDGLRGKVVFINEDNLLVTETSYLGTPIYSIYSNEFFGIPKNI